MDERAWYEIRDLFFGHNFHEQNIARALELAKLCQHEKAQWLTKLFENRQVTLVSDARAVLKLYPHDLNAVLFDACFDKINCSETIIRIAHTGNAFAQSIFAEESPHFLESSVKQGERDALLWYGDRYNSQSYLLRAANLGCAQSMVMYALRSQDVSSADCFDWLGKAALIGHYFPFYIRITHHSAAPTIRYIIGKWVARGALYTWNMQTEITQTSELFHAQNKAYKLAVNTFSLCCLRNCTFYKDLRVLIGQWIWAGRGEAAY